MNIAYKSKDTLVKCLTDGELSAERKDCFCLAVCILHPASYGIRETMSFFYLMIRGKGGFFMSSENKRKSNKRVAVFGTLNILVCVSLLVAMSIVCGKYLAFGVGNVLRFSFENLPIMLAGIWFGPIVGLVAGVVADIVGSLMVGYAINPLVTVGAAAVGFVSGGVYALAHKKLDGTLSLALTVLLAHLCGSVIIKTIGLAAFYDMPITLLLAWRILNYTAVGALEGLIIFAVTENKSVSAMIARIKGRGK